MFQTFFGHSTDEPLVNEVLPPAVHKLAWGSSTNNARFYFAQAGTVSFPRILLGTAPGTSNGFTFEARKNNSASGAIELDFDATATDVGDAGSTITVAAGDYLNLRCTLVTGTPDFSDISVAWTFEGDTAGLAISSSGNQTGNSATSTKYITLFAPWFLAPGVTEAQVADLCPLNATLNSIKVFLTGAPGAVQNFTVFKNGVEEVSAQFTITTPATTGEVTGLSIDMAPGDLFTLEWENTHTSTVSATGVMTTYTPDVEGESFVGGHTNRGLDAAATEYNSWRTASDHADGQWTATEADHEGLMNGATGAPDWVMKNMRIQLNDAPGASTDFTLTTRKNGGDGSSVVVISGASETEDVDAVNEDTYAGGDTGAIKCVPTNTSTSRRANWSAIQYIAPPSTVAQSINRSVIGLSMMNRGGING